jgi:trans-aconitate 2-methyltransferase
MPIDWDPERYLAFAGPRLRPALDLLARVPLSEAGTVVDLGCGPGNLVRHLRRSYPQARIIGVDSSGDLLGRARVAHPEIEFVEADLERWAPDAPVDLIFSNAALPWLADQEELFPHLIGLLRPGGVLAVQMGNHGGAVSHRLVGEIAVDGPWSERLRGHYRPLPELAAAPYYRWLAPLAEQLDIWETVYLHALEGEEPVFDWARSSTVLPALAHLDEEEAAEFLHRYREALRLAYPREADRRTLFPFRRLFIVARARA